MCYRKFREFFRYRHKFSILAQNVSKVLWQSFLHIYEMCHMKNFGISADTFMLKSFIKILIFVPQKFNGIFNCMLLEVKLIENIAVDDVTTFDRS